MFVLTVQSGLGVTIAGVPVYVVAQGGKVRVSVDAPKSVKVSRIERDRHDAGAVQDRTPVDLGEHLDRLLP